MDLECSGWDSSDSMEYPPDDQTSAYERRVLKIKRRRERAFLAQFKQGEIAKASQLLPKKKDESDEEFKPVADTPRKKRTYKRRSMPAIALQPRKSQRLDGKPVKYVGLDDDFKEPPSYRRRQSLGGKPVRRSMPRIALPREVDFNPDSLSGEVCYNASKVYSQNGTTCHQCRQKTIDLKSRCYSPYCRGVRGQFCGYCLRQRYGEDVAVVLRDPKWKCPPCRNICNCSICRRRYGKEPTGQLYQYVSCQGYANVKDYLAEKNDLILIEDDGEDNDDELAEKEGDEDEEIQIKEERITPEPEDLIEDDTDEVNEQTKVTPKQMKSKKKSPKENTNVSNDVAAEKRKVTAPNPKRRTRSMKENVVPDIEIKEEPIDVDPSLYPNVDFKPKVMLEKFDPDNLNNEGI